MANYPDRPAMPLAYDDAIAFARDFYALVTMADDSRLATIGGREDGAHDVALMALYRQFDDRPELQALLDEVDRCAQESARVAFESGMAFGVLSEQFRAGVIALIRACGPHESPAQDHAR